MNLLIHPPQASAGNVSLAWDANGETNLAGYYLYYGRGASAQNYNGTGLDQGDSPILIRVSDLNNPVRPSYFLSGLDETQDYCFAVTAYNKSGLESDRSNPLDCPAKAGSDPGVDEKYALIPGSGIRVAYVDSEEVNRVNACAEKTLDGRADTIWHTEWYYADPDFPHEIVYDLGGIYSLGVLRYLPRQDGYENGMIQKYAVYVSLDRAGWGTPVASGSFLTSKAEKHVALSEKMGRYVRFVALSEVNGKPSASAAEIKMYGTPCVDRDADGLSDYEEINLYGTDPLDADTDGDGIPDGEERDYWQSGWNADLDGDGVVNLLDADADNDGLDDGKELGSGTDPAVAPPSVQDPPLATDYAVIPQSQMRIAYVDSEERVGKSAGAENAIDGRSVTIWHTEWFNADPEYPHEIILDLGRVYEVGGFRYLPRQDGNKNGIIAGYALYVGLDGHTWGTPVKQGVFAADKKRKNVSFTGKPGRYLRFVASSEINGNPWASAAELNVLGKAIADRDGDGLTDYEEADTYGTDPDVADSDGDGIPDGEELDYWQGGWADDLDRDGRICLLDADADGDGFSDGEELAVGTDPGNAAGSVPKYTFIPQSRMCIAYTDSEELEGTYKPAVYAIDGRKDTIWHTEWYQTDPDFPHEIVIDLGAAYQVGGVNYLPRQDGTKNGIIIDYAVYVGEDGATWGTAVAKGTFAANDRLKKIKFRSKPGRYLRFVGLSEIKGHPWASAAEINVLALTP